MVFAAVIRASLGGRPKRLESVNWNRVARLLSGLSPAPSRVKTPSEPCRSNLEPVVNSGVYENMNEDMAAQLVGTSCVLGVNASARLPVYVA